MIISTFSGMISTAVTWLCCAKRVAIESPTYPVPATAIFIQKSPSSWPCLISGKQLCLISNSARATLQLPGISATASVFRSPALLLRTISAKQEKEESLYYYNRIMEHMTRQHLLPLAFGLLALDYCRLSFNRKSSIPMYWIPFSSLHGFM